MQHHDSGNQQEDGSVIMHSRSDHAATDTQNLVELL